MKHRHVLEVWSMLRAFYEPVNLFDFARSFCQGDENHVLCFHYYACSHHLLPGWGKIFSKLSTNDDITSSSHHQEKIKVFSNYGDGLMTWGKEEVISNYMELSEDPKGDWIRSSKPCHSVVQVICPRSSQSAVQSGYKTSQSLYISSIFTRLAVRH